MFKLNYISVEVAKRLESILKPLVIPSENRVLVFSPGDEEVTSGGIIIPGNVKEGRPRKGVVILQGMFDENHLNFECITQTGMIITYGLYAGKEVEFDDASLFTETQIQQIISKGKFTILDTNEIIMAEVNLNK